MSELVPTAERINAEYRAFEREKKSVVEHAQSGLQHAINAGEMLSEVKASLSHGEFLPWLESNFEGTPRYAQMFMKLEREQEQLNTKRISHLSISGALRELEPPEENKPEREERPTLQDLETKANEALRKAREGKAEARTSHRKAQYHMTMWTRELEETDRYLKESYGQMSADEYMRASGKYQRSIDDHRKHRERLEEQRRFVDLLDRLDGEGEKLSDEEITVLLVFAASREGEDHGR